MFKVLANTWLSAIVGLMLAVVAWYLGYKTVAEVVALIGFAGSFCIQLKKYRPSMTHAFLCGTCIGTATILWYYSAIGVVIVLLLLFGVMKVYSRKVFWNIVFGFLTPLWLYLPYFLFEVIVERLEVLGYR